MKIYENRKFSKVLVIYYEICNKMISKKKTNDDKLDLKQRIIRYFIEPAYGTIEKNVVD